MEKLNGFKTALTLVFAAIFVSMVAVTVHASRAVSLWNAWDSFAANPWAVATLYDAYFGFFTFWVWVAYRERSPGVRVLWLLLIFALGNIAMSLYVLVQIFGLKPDEPVDGLFRRKPDRRREMRREPR
jgi:hypothetical protein